MILNQPDFFARSATLDGAISDTDTQITLSGLSTRFTDAVTAGTVRYPAGPFRISDDDGFELIAVTGHVSGTTFDVERGIQGTTAEAWADGTAVRAVVTRDVILKGQQAKDAASIIYHDDFARSDRNLDGDVAPTGQVYTDLNLSSDQPVIRKQFLTTDRTSSGDSAIGVSIGTALALSARPIFYNITGRACTGEGLGTRVFVRFAMQSPDDYLEFRFGDWNGNLSIRKRVNGSITTLASSNIGNHALNGYSGRFSLSIGGSEGGGQDNVRFVAEVAGLRAIYNHSFDTESGDHDPEIQSILDNNSNFALGVVSGSSAASIQNITLSKLLI